MSRPSFAISTHLYHDTPLGRDQLVEIAAHGFDAVELFVNRPHLASDDAPAVQVIEEALQDSGLRVHSLHAPIAEALRNGRWTGPFSIASSQEAVRSRAVAEVLASLELARRLGAGILVVHVGVPDSQQPSAEDNREDAARRSLEELHAAAKAAGVRLALEVMPNRLSRAERLAAWIEDDLDMDDVGICFDFGHAYLAGDVVDAVEAVSGHLLTTHVHDNHGQIDEHLLPFEGEIGWESALMAVRKIGYEGAFVFELAGSATPRRVLERAQRVRARFDALLTQ
ncbi:MAG TPA: sugar phosphate isomerase/epimerase family protein [Vicinamibacterales bacterium]|nr:sugar phosphate isomerase/epimerase family protein [Vicinamibacterales bacterium]